jgi:hypothetical protein
MDPNKIRNLLALTGADLKNIDNSFAGDYRYGDSTGNRMVVSNSLDNADYMMKNRLGLNTQPRIQEKYYQQPVQYIPQPVSHPIPQMYTPPPPSREDRLNKLLGKSTQPIVQQPVISDEHALLVSALKEALTPLTEQLEDIAILNGLLVQRLEKLIKVVDPNVDFDAPDDNFQSTENFEQDSELPDNLEVYNPEVTMSVTEDETASVPTQTKRKKTKKTK